MCNASFYFDSNMNFGSESCVVTLNCASFQVVGFGWVLVSTISLLGFKIVALAPLSFYVWILIFNLKGKKSWAS